jgi:hypothetical protein
MTVSHPGTILEAVFPLFLPCDATIATCELRVQKLEATVLNTLLSSLPIVLAAA